jgi:hypothetical protein
MRISVLALDGVFDTGLSVTLDALSTATALSAKLFGGTPRFDVTTVGVRRTVHTSQGLTVPVQSIKPTSKPDWVIVPAVLAGTPKELFAKLKRARRVSYGGFVRYRCHRRISHGTSRLGALDHPTG